MKNRVLCTCFLALAACGEDTALEQPAYDGYPYLSHFVELDDGVSMHYLDEGVGEPIVLLHGVPTQAYLWRDVIPSLQESGRVIAPDMINFGLSDKTEPLTPAEHLAYLEQLFDALELENATLVLHDWGVPIGVAYAAAHPDRVRALAFFEGPVLPIPDMSIVPPFMMQHLIDPVTARPSLVDDNWFIECFLLDPMCGAVAQAATDAERQVYRAPFQSPEDREQLLLLPQHLPFLDTTGHPVLDPDGPGGEPALPSPSIDMFHANADYLTSSETPKLFIHGTPGTLPDGQAYAMALQMMFPNLQVAAVGSAENPVRHFVQEDAPEELGQRLAGFIDGL